MSGSLVSLTRISVGGELEWGVNEPRNSQLFYSQNCFQGMYRHRYVQKFVIVVCYTSFTAFKSIPEHSTST